MSNSSANKDMTNQETAAHLRAWVTQPHGIFAWPTDACSYDQHLRFVYHRNAHWQGGSSVEFMRFILAYADSLEEEETCG